MDFQNLPSILTPDWGLLFWMLLAFLVIFFFLAKYGFPAITKMVEERKAYIDESLRKAHEANEKLANIQQEGETLLKEARERAIDFKSMKEISEITGNFKKSEAWGFFGMARGDAFYKPMLELFEKLQKNDALMA